jgi:hypothetical protein
MRGEVGRRGWGAVPNKGGAEVIQRGCVVDGEGIGEWISDR